MVDPIKTNALRQGPSKLSSQLDAPTVRSSTSFQAPPKTPAREEAPTVKQGQPKGDTVELSPAAQARLLHLQGMSIPDIALQLRLDIATVNSFFAT
jgi:hypothetical protein